MHGGEYCFSFLNSGVVIIITGPPPTLMNTFIRQKVTARLKTADKNIKQNF